MDACNITAQHFEMFSKTKWKRGPKLDRFEYETIDFEGSVQGNPCGEVVCRAGFHSSQQDIGKGPSRSPRERLPEPAASFFEIASQVVRETKGGVSEKDRWVLWITRQRQMLIREAFIRVACPGQYSAHGTQSDGTTWADLQRLA